MCWPLYTRFCLLCWGQVYNTNIIWFCRVRSWSGNKSFIFVVDVKMQYFELPLVLIFLSIELSQIPSLVILWYISITKIMVNPTSVRNSLQGNMREAPCWFISWLPYLSFEFWVLLEISVVLMDNILCQVAFEDGIKFTTHMAKKTPHAKALARLRQTCVLFDRVSVDLSAWVDFIGSNLDVSLSA